MERTISSKSSGSHSSRAAAARAAAAAKDKADHYIVDVTLCKQVNSLSNMARPIRLVRIERGPMAMKPDLAQLQLTAGDGSDPGPLGLTVTQ